MAATVPTQPEQPTRFNFPTAYTILLALIVLIAAITWIIPAGKYERVASELLGKEIPIAGTYAPTDPNPQGFFDVILAPIAGFYVRNSDGDMQGVEAVIDKDRTAALLALELKADALLLLTDVAAVFEDYGGPDQRARRATTADALDGLDLAPGSMGPKVAAASDFARKSGKLAGIGRLSDARAILEGRAGTRVIQERPDAPI